MIRLIFILIQMACFIVVQYIGRHALVSWQFWTVAAVFVVYNVTCQLYAQFKERDEFLDFWWSR